MSIKSTSTCEVLLNPDQSTLLPSLQRRGARGAGWSIPLWRGVAQRAGVCYIISILFSLTTQAAMINDSIFQKPDPNIQTRWYTPENTSGKKGEAGKANFGRKGSPFFFVKPGETLVMADIKGSGTIRRIWSTTEPCNDPEVLRSLKLEIFWDEAKKPAVQVPLGDFYCHTFGKMTKFENIFFSCPEARSYNCYIPMPFKKSAKIQLTNESKKTIRIFYEINCTLGENHNNKMMYFHSSWRRENFTKAREDFTILPKISGTGRFLGCNIGMRQNPAMKGLWFGEGEVKIFLDGDKKWPTLCGTGTEDFIGTGWGQHQFDDLYQGCQYVSDQGDGSARTLYYGFYRFNAPDPIYFHKDIKVIIQALSGANARKDLLNNIKTHTKQKYMKAGKGGEYFSIKEVEELGENFVMVESEDDFCATAYWYMDSPVNSLPELAPLKERIADLPK